MCNYTFPLNKSKQSLLHLYQAYLFPCCPLPISNTLLYLLVLEVDSSPQLPVKNNKNKASLFNLIAFKACQTCSIAKPIVEGLWPLGGQASEASNCTNHGQLEWDNMLSYIVGLANFYPYFLLKADWLNSWEVKSSWSIMLRQLVTRLAIRPARAFHYLSCHVLCKANTGNAIPISLRF